MMSPPRRKKWTEAEERTLIDKYGDMISDGILSKMKTREKKFKPIALFVNSMHYACDPVAYPWQWGWKDVCTKVQNMRHQYSLVKQKIKKSKCDSDRDEFDWVEGLTYWSNFLRYKEVFGDVERPFGENMGLGNEENGGFAGSSHAMEGVPFGHLDHSGDGNFENGVMGIEFDYERAEGEGNYNGNGDSDCLKENGDNGFVHPDIEPTGSDTRKKRKMAKGSEKRMWKFVANQLAQLKEMESRFERREEERERERQRRERLLTEKELERNRKWEAREKQRLERDKVMEKLRQQRNQEWEAMEEESKERQIRREEELMREREWEERMNRRRSEWKMRINEMMSHHRVEMNQIQTRILHEQQNLSNQLLGVFSQWTGHPTGLSDHTTTNHYLSQMMQNLHNVNDIVDGDNRVEGENQDDQFIVDG